jgi:hypothetical protein
VRIPETVEIGHHQRVGDLRAREAQPTQCGDRLDPPLVGAVGDRPGRRRAIVESALALGEVTLDKVRHVRSLTPAAWAASVTDRPSSTTASTIRRRAFRLSAALACNCIR